MLLFSIRAFVELFFLFFDALWVMGSTVGTMFLLHPNRPPTLRLEELPGGWDAHVICRIYCGPIIPHLFFEEELAENDYLSLNTNSYGGFKICTTMKKAMSTYI